MPLATSFRRHLHDALIAILSRRVNDDLIEIADLILNDYNRDIDTEFHINALQGAQVTIAITPARASCEAAEHV